MDKNSKLNNLRSRSHAYRSNHHICLKPHSRDTLERTKAQLADVIGKPPSTTLIVRRALQIYATYLLSIQSTEDWETEGHCVKALR